MTREDQTDCQGIIQSFQTWLFPVLRSSSAVNYNITHLFIEIYYFNLDLMITVYCLLDASSAIYSCSSNTAL